MVLSITALQGLNVEENGVSGPFFRPLLNIVQGSDIGVVVADNVGNDSVDVTISVAGAFLTSGTHASIDHTGLTGVGSYLGTGTTTVTIPANTLTADGEFAVIDAWGAVGGASSVTVTAGQGVGTAYTEVNGLATAFHNRVVVQRTSATGYIIATQPTWNDNGAPATPASVSGSLSTGWSASLAVGCGEASKMTALAAVS